MYAHVFGDLRLTTSLALNCTSFYFLRQSINFSITPMFMSISMLCLCFPLPLPFPISASISQPQGILLLFLSAVVTAVHSHAQLLWKLGSDGFIATLSWHSLLIVIMFVRKFR